MRHGQSCFGQPGFALIFSKDAVGRHGAGQWNRLGGGGLCTCRTLQGFTVLRYTAHSTQGAICRTEQGHAALLNRLQKERLHGTAVTGQHQHRRFGGFPYGGDDVVSFVPLGHSGADRNSQHNVADALVIQHGEQQLANQSRLADADGGVVQWILGHGISRQHGRELVHRAGRQLGQIQTQVIGKVQRNIFHCA